MDNIYYASPFFSIIAALVNVIGSVISCCGVNFITGKDNINMGNCLVIAGGLLLFLGSIMTIFTDMFIGGRINQRLSDETL